MFAGSRSRRIEVLTSVLALSAALTACTPSVFGEERSNAGYLVVALKEAPDRLDPTMAGSYVGRIVFANMCEKLYDVNDQLQLVPQLAAALPDITDGGLTYTIRLRQALFNDGTPLTAQAVKISLDRDKQNKQSQRTSELTSLKSVEVVDPATVRLHLSRPFAPLTSVLADRAGMVMSPAALQRYGDNFAQHPVCVGPFAFSSEPSPDEINLIKSDYYYDKDKVRLPGVTFRAITDDSVRAADLRAGDVDVIDRASPQDAVSLSVDPSLTVRTVTSLGYQGITINVGNAKGYDKPPATPNTPLARDVRLRKAFELSLDRDVINKVVFDGAYLPDCSPIPPASPLATGIPCSRRDLQQARELIRQSGVPTPITVRMMVQNSPLQVQIGTIIQAMAKDAGFDVRVEPSEFATSLQRGRTGQFDTFQIGWSGRLDADQNISQEYLPGSALNYGGLIDPEINRLINAARETTDQALRKQLYNQLVTRANEQLGIIYLYHDKYVLAMRKNVTGVVFFGDGLIRVGTARVER
jgi:peptide/nickel transport system substrate-binding protein